MAGQATDQRVVTTVTVLAPYIPRASLHHAGGVHLTRWAEGLARRGLEVTVVSPTGPHGDHLDADERLEPAPYQRVIVPVPTPRFRALRRLVEIPLLAPGPGVTRAIRRDARARAALSSADVVEVHWNELVRTARLAGARPERTVAVAHDIVFDAKRRQAATASRVRSRAAARLQSWVFRRVEPRRLGRCAGVTVFSPRDEALLRDRGVTAPITIVAPALEPCDEHGPADTVTALFVGAFNRPENQDAAAWLTGEIWPRVLQRVAHARLVLAGANPPHWLTGSQTDSVEVTGALDDLNPVYRQASACVVPLRGGAGLKFKVLEALRRGLPVVASTVAADGYVQLGAAPVLVAVSDDPEELADALAGLLEDHDRAVAAGAAGAAWAAASFDAEASLDAAAARYTALAGARR